MPLDPYFTEKIALVQDLTIADIADPEKLQLIIEYFTDEAPWALPAGVVAEDHEVDVGDHVVPVRVYRPSTERVEPLIWLHGGGFAGGDLDMPEAHIVSAELAFRAGATVISVGYRLASETVRYPAPVDDAIAALDWASKRYSSRRPAIGGASAGGAIAISAALRAQAETATAPRALLLGYPFAHFPNPAMDFSLSAEMSTLPPLLRFTPDGVSAMVEGYVGRTTNLPPAAMPGAADLTSLPPVSIVISEMDDLRPSADLLAKQLQESGVKSRVYIASGMPHGHLNRVPTIPEVSRSLDFLAEAL